MNFKKYSSIENSYRDKEIKKIRISGFAEKDIEWVVTEKIHGTNFSFISDGNEVKVAKRTSILNENEISKFFDADIMLEKYSQNVKELANYLKRIYNISYVQVFGEHFGGIFKGETEKGYTKIQREVEYIPFTDFMVFDILITKDDKQKFLNWDDVKDLCNKFELKTVPELFRGTFDECLEYQNDYLTKIPEIYGLKNFKGNITEGNVIKPVKALFFPSGERVILKNKNNKFKEKGRVKKLKNKSINLSDEDKKWVQKITKYFENIRIQNLLSKGDVKLEWEQFAKLSGLFFKDALEDFIKDNSDFEKLDKETRKIIQKYAQIEAQNFIRKFMKKHI